MFWMSDACAFCGQKSPLKESHVLPAFIFRWLRNRSGSGHIRHTENPNKRVQDGLKLHWLCGDCETKFSKYETAFATKLFHPWHSGQRKVTYSDWLLKFCVSVSWRVLKFARGHNPKAEYSDEQITLMDKAEQRWRGFLNGNVPHPSDFEQHLLIFDFAESTNIRDLPNNFNRFMSGAITLDIIGSSRSLMTFSKLGSFMIFGVIQKGPDPWIGTKIHVRDGIIKPGEFTVPIGLLDVFKEKAQYSSEAMSKISSPQRQKIKINVLENLDKFKNSNQFSAIKADVKMFGQQAVLWKEDPEDKY